MPPKCTVCGQHYWHGNPCKCKRVKCIPDAHIETSDATATKAAQVAAIRVRLGDMDAGATWLSHSVKARCVSISWAIMEVWRVPVESVKCGSLDSLAAWLWERGCRA